MTNLQMKYYIKVFELLSITAAAEELYVSRPVISRVINELESEFNTVLFERMPRGLKPTESGVAVYKLFISTLKNYETTVERLQCLNNVSENSLIRIGLLTTNINRVYDIVIKGYMETHPNVHFSIIERSLADNIDSLHNEASDLLFIPSGSIETIDTDFAAYPMFLNKIVLVVSKNHYLASRQIITLEDLLDVPLGHRDTPLPSGDALNAAFELFDRKPNVVVRTSSSDILKDMTISGKCCALVCESMISNWNDVVAIPIEFYKSLHNYLVWNQAIPLSSCVKSFIEYAKQHSQTAGNANV